MAASMGPILTGSGRPPVNDMALPISFHTMPSLELNALDAPPMRAVGARYRLSPKSRRDLADNLAATLNSLGDQLLPPEG